MTSFERWTLWISIAGVAINVVLFVVFATQLWYLRRQVREATSATDLDHSQRKAQATIDFYLSTIEKRFLLAATLPNDRDAQAIYALTSDGPSEEDPRSASIVEYLSVFELFAGALVAGVFDVNLAEKMSGGRLVAIFYNYHEWIARRRTALGVPRLYSDLEDLVKRFVANDPARYAAIVGLAQEARSATPTAKQAQKPNVATNRRRATAKPSDKP